MRNPQAFGWDASDGKNLVWLHDNFTAFCDGCTGTAQQIQEQTDRNWLANINIQAMNAALHRAVSGVVATFSPCSGFTRYTNFGYVGTDGVLDPSHPPYTYAGLPERRLSYRDGVFYMQYHNYADFNSPVSYAFPRKYNGMTGGLGTSDFVLQNTREALEMVLFSDPRTGGGGLATSPFFMTPWIAGINQYFVSGDHHRKLLALMRAKKCQEFNVFMFTDASTHDRMMANWTKFRHIFDQVWGFDIDAGNTVVTAGQQTGGDGSDLDAGDFHFLDVDGAQDCPIFQTTPTFCAQITAPFQVFKVAQPAAPYNAFSIRDSAKLRVNLEYVSRVVDDRDFEVTPVVEVWNPGKSAWINVPMTRTCVDANNTAFGIRTIMSGDVSNDSHRLVLWPHDTDLSGTTTVRVTLSAHVNFTAHFDLVQVVGVDANESDMDWNHDGVVNAQDLMDYLEDFNTMWVRVGRTRYYVGGELWALDANNDGWISIDDPCAFEARFEQQGLLTPAACTAFVSRMRTLNIDCTDTWTTNHCAPPGDDH